ncbi:MAG: DNA polymerase III subunit gamma/tau [Alphaproteobacteria bacterium]
MTDARPDAPYRVLARKYRPTQFTGLIGQETLVRTLSNALEGGRLAQAYLLTGVRGVGKTTAARIIARALNCVGPDGKGGPTPTPCGVCEHCRTITEDRHIDVLEMDAASRTGVDDIRELIDGVRYRPTSARYKVYIIDEVHMISEKAFNALLKTLEEPPPHVKFIFATTEIRKIPLTVLSRCQRFDLRRVEADKLLAHLETIVAKEGVEAEPAALALIARAADGSVRDGLSILDQAIAHGDGRVTEEMVREMLGLADRAQVFDLFEAVMAGKVRQALDLVRSQYDAGLDPVVLLQDLLDLTHWVTRLKIAPEAADAATVSELERVRGRTLAERLSMPVLSRAWQMLLKGLNDVRTAPTPLGAAEMVLVRLAYVADLPSPAEVVKGETAEPEFAPLTDLAPATGGGGPAEVHGGQSPGEAPSPAGGPQAALAQAVEAAAPEPQSFREVVALADGHRAPALREPGEAAMRSPRTAAAQHPHVVAVMKAFPGASVTQVREAAPSPHRHPAEGGETR